jgi:protocadherin-16/23
VREDVPVGFVVGSIGVSEHSDVNNLIASNSVHITYTLTPLTNDVIVGAFDMDRNSGSLVVARKLDREQQSEFRLEIRALDISASNNPQSSAVTVKVEIADCNDNAPVWEHDPITIEIPEDTQVGTILFNFTATDADSGSNSEIQYKLEKQVPLLEESEISFAVDPLTGALTLLTSLDYETLSEYILFVTATDQSSNASVRLTTSVTARIIIIDINDHVPFFVQPTSKDSIVYLSDSATVGQLVTHVIAVDKDNGDNGLITYSIINGNEDGRFNIDPENGFIELAKPLIRKIESNSKSTNVHNSVSNLISGKYNLVVSASDHGTPSSKVAKVNIKIIIQGSTNNPPRFLENIYYANITENVAIGSFVVRVNAKSFNNENGKFIKKKI